VDASVSEWTGITQPTEHPLAHARSYDPWAYSLALAAIKAASTIVQVFVFRVFQFSQFFHHLPVLPLSSTIFRFFQFFRFFHRLPFSSPIGFARGKATGSLLARDVS
jgi:hypothetical protein